MSDLIKQLRLIGGAKGLFEKTNLADQAADLIEQQQREIEAYKLKYEGKNLVWFERDEVHGLDPEQTGLINLGEVKAKAVEDAIESVRYKYTYTHDSYGFFKQHAQQIRNGKDGE